MTYEFDEERRTTFLDKYNCKIIEPAGKDVSSRRYFRVDRAGRKEILMEAIPDAIGDSWPGHKMHDFVELGNYLRSNGLHTPEIYEVDFKGGYMLLEDFGSMSFKRAAEEGVANRRDLYALATDILVKIRDLDNLPKLPEYFKGRIHASHKNIILEALPHIRGEENPTGLLEEYLSIWDKIEQSVPQCPQSFMHIDYHGENLHWLPEFQGTDRCGIIDYQEAMIGPCVYDLANLLEDARIDVPMDIRAEMMDIYCAGMTKEERVVIESWFRILATQFHCRVLGLFIRLVHKDGVDKYAPYIPVLRKHLREGFKDPLLKPLKDFFDQLSIDF